MPSFTVKHLAWPIYTRKFLRKGRVRGFQYSGSSGNRDSGQNRIAGVAAACALLVFAGHARAHAQTLQAQISLISTEPARARIDLQLPAATDALSFRNSYGAILGLAERIEAMEASNERGEIVHVQKIAPGQFRSTENFSRASYSLSLAEPTTPGMLAQTSWIGRDHGLLMPADLLPQTTGRGDRISSVQIGFEVPRGWTIASNVTNFIGGRYSTDEPDDAVFLFGPSVKVKSKQMGPHDFSVALSGQWPFSHDDALKISRKLLEEYSKVTGFRLRADSTLMLLPFPGKAGPERWSAETRGNNVVLLLGNTSDRERAVVTLGVVLSHELFHLWVPNSLSLDGDYDWFFEGFTLYQALVTVLRLRLISFDDFLDTIGRVYKSYLAAGNRDHFSLVESSARRWTTAPSLVYDKGMLVAFVYDVMLRRKTDCKSSSGDIYRQLFRTHWTGQENANDTIINLLGGRDGMESFVKNYVQEAGRFDLESLLSTYGLQVRRNSLGVKVTVAPDLAREQRHLLKCLGYRK